MLLWRGGEKKSPKGKKSVDVCVLQRLISALPSCKQCSELISFYIPRLYDVERGRAEGHGCIWTKQVALWGNDLSRIISVLCSRGLAIDVCGWNDFFRRELQWRHSYLNYHLPDWSSSFYLPLHTCRSKLCNQSILGFISLSWTWFVPWVGKWSSHWRIKHWTFVLPSKRLLVERKHGLLNMKKAKSHHYIVEHYYNYLQLKYL